MKTLSHTFGAALVCSAAFCSSLSAAAAARSLFNGKDLSGWKGEGYVVEEGAIVCTPQGRNLMTEETFADYRLTFSFKLPPGGNNGLGIHYPGTGDGAYAGMELQILDSTHPKYKDLKDYQFHGGLYTLAAAKQGALKPVGEWNTQVVTVHGSKLEIVLNGKKILDVKLDELATKHPQHAGVKRRSGHIGFLGHGDRVAFRDIRIEEIAPAADPAAASFTPIFDGATLKGWKHTPDTTNWVAANDILKHNGRKGAVNDLWTEKSYKDCTLSFNWRWSGRGPVMPRPVVQPDGSDKGTVEVEELDSGIYLRGNTKSQVNLWNWTVGSGEVYGYRTDGSMPAEVKAGVTPKAKADKPPGEWNHMVVTLKGEELSVTLNGRLVIDKARLPGIPAEGPLGLQHHGGAIDFANLRVSVP